MGTRRTSRKHRGRSSPLKPIILLVLVGGIGYGAYSLLFAGDDNPETSRAEELLGTSAVLEAADTPINNATTSNDSIIVGQLQSLADRCLRDMRATKGKERHALLVENYHSLAKALEKPLPPSIRARLLPAFHNATDELFFSNIRNEFSTDYIVQAGDSIGEIAQKFDTTEELLCDWNNIDWNKRHLIRTGVSYKIVKGDVRIVVDKSDYCLSFYFGDKLAHQFIVAHGKGNGTPEGSAKVNGKVIDPDTAPHAGPMQQEMDERWIGFTQFGKRTGIGIHGTKYENSIPGETSHGCIRMFNKDVVDLYRWVPYGASVHIRG